MEVLLPPYSEVLLPTLIYGQVRMVLKQAEQQLITWQQAPIVLPLPMLIPVRLMNV